MLHYPQFVYMNIGGYKTVGHGIYELQNDVKLVYEIMEKKLNEKDRTATLALEQTLRIK